jgi:hypothetical protein
LRKFNNNAVGGGYVDRFYRMEKKEVWGDCEELREWRKGGKNERK